ncbi:MAG TPA: general secretion pathway protein GspK [Spirochaetota bacterium]|nr:general secretion pathway protein GspK [Spirochaetota bacterium]HPJ35408.1 general secretion pathway protein GspK [Spirochaetota bacterium]
MLYRFINNYNKRKKAIEKDGLASYILNDRGYILLIVLLISAFLVSFTSDFFLRTHTYISYIKRLKSDINSEFLSYSGYEIAKAILDVDRLGISGSFMPSLNSDKNIDSYKDIWALDFPEIPVEGYSLKIEIHDENSKINVSALANDKVEKTPYYGILQRLLMNMGLSLDIADALVDWVDPDDVRFPYGAESSGYYYNLIPSYSAKNGQLDSIAEIMLVKGITPEIYYGIGGGNFGLEKNLVEDNKGDVTIPPYKINEILNSEEKREKTDIEEEESEKKIGKERSRLLSDYLTAYGEWDNFIDESNRININTASFRVLSSLTEDMTEETATEIIRKRQLEPFKTVSEIGSYIKYTSTLANILTVKSRIFRITVTIKNENSYCRSIYYFNRDEKKLLYCSMGH